MNDDFTLETSWEQDAYAAGTGAAAQGCTLAQAIAEAEASGAPFSEAERAALVAGWWDRKAFEMDMANSNDHAA